MATLTYTFTKAKKRKAKKRKLRQVKFIDGHDRQHTIYLGDMDDKQAREICTRVEQLNSAARVGGTLPENAAGWLRNLPPALYDKLAKHGLCPPRDAGKVVTLGEYTKQYKASRTDVKESTHSTYDQAIRCLIACFGKNKPLKDFNAGDGAKFRRYLSITEGLAENTVRGRCARAKQIFTAAIKQRLISENPFTGLKCNVVGNRERDYFVTREITAKVLTACPDTESRLLFMLARIGGLRCPSETFSLRWPDVDWERNCIKVTSPKTAHHDGKETRFIPIFKDLRPYLEAARAEAPKGAEFVITHYRGIRNNPRAHLMRIVERAGLPVWPKLWQNLRSTRETELRNENEFSTHLICAWIGHSKDVAMKHYLQVQQADFDRASGSTSHITSHNLAKPNGLEKQNGLCLSSLSLENTGKVQLSSVSERESNRASRTRTYNQQIMSLLL